MKFNICNIVIGFLLLCTFTPVARAQDVTLTSQDGLVEISGALLAYDGEFFRVNTIFGALTLDATGVTCDGSGCPNLEHFVAEVTISGAQSMGEVLMPALVEGFASSHDMSVERIIKNDAQFIYVLTQQETNSPVVRITFQMSNTQEGFSKLATGKSDLVLAMREVTDDENMRVRDAGGGDLRHAARSRIIALDALVPVVARGNPVIHLPLEDLAKIVAGEITNWKNVGGADAPIYIHLRDETSGLDQQFNIKVMNEFRLNAADSATRHDSASSLVDAVSADPFSIGITRYSEIGSAQPISLLGDCGIRFKAGITSIKTEDYPLSTPLFLYSPAHRKPKIVREFLKFLRSPISQRIVRNVGFVDQDIISMPVNQQGERLANAIKNAGEDVKLGELKRMVTLLQSSTRLSLTFRFRAGSSKLDAQSRANVILLARMLEAGQYEGRRLNFVGFSDGDGGAGANLKISLSRAKSVRRAVVNAADTLDLSNQPLGVEAFGEALPMACDDIERGRQTNRRVEVWVQ